MNTPTLNPRDVQRAIRQIESLDLKETSISDIETLLTPLFRGYRTAAPRFDAGLYVHRARKCAKPIRLAEISYPPAESVNAIGRANDIGESIFYCATGRAVPFFELGVRPGDHIALSKWKTTGPILLNHIGFSSEPESFKDAKRQLDSIYGFVRGSKSFGDLNTLVHDYLAYSFSRPIKETGGDYYKLTNAICRKLFRDEMFDGLLYPTIQMSGNADNIAFKADAVDRLLRFVNVEFAVAKAVRGMKIDIDILDSASRADLAGTLMWSGRTLQWKLRKHGEQLAVVSEGGEWVGYDTWGNRVDPE